MPNKQRLLTLVTPLWASVVDITITTIHQTQAYWDGELNQANEGNPIGKVFMENHTSGLFIISGIWIAMICLGGYYLPQRVARIFLLFVLIAHSFGASTWFSSKYGFFYAMLLILINSILFWVMYDKATKSEILTELAQS